MMNCVNISRGFFLTEFVKKYVLNQLFSLAQDLTFFWFSFPFRVPFNFSFLLQGTWNQIWRWHQVESTDILLRFYMRPDDFEVSKNGLIWLNCNGLIMVRSVFGHSLRILCIFLIISNFPD